MTPRDLPRWRAQMVRHLGDPEAPIRSQTTRDMHQGLDALADHCRHAALYFATADMAALAVHAGASLESASWATADRPAECGLIAFEGGVGHVDTHGTHVPIDALTWGPHAGSLMVWGLVSRRRFTEEIARRNGGAFSSAAAAGSMTVGELLNSGQTHLLDEARTPPLLPLLAGGLPLGESAGLPGGPLSTALRALAAAWLLMEQPQLVDRTVDRNKGPARKAAARAGLPAPEISVVDLRRQYVPGGDAEDGVDGGRRYHHRWVVSGHWRQQPHGPGREQRRRQWVAAHVKGPDGAPMLASERVNVWRR